MTEEKIQFFKDNGIDANRLIRLLGNNDTLFLKFTNKFFGASEIAELDAAIESMDIDVGFKAAHSLKGMAGNVGLTRLYLILSEMVSAYRLNDLAKVVQEYTMFSQQLAVAKAAVAQL